MLTGIFLTLGAALCGSIGYISVKRGLETTDYKVFILLSISIGVFISGSLLWSIDMGLSGITLRAVFPFIVTGGLGGGLLARISTTVATHEIGASRTHALASVSPLVTALFGVVLLNEVISLQLGIGVLTVVVGASFLSYLVYKSDSDNNQTVQNHPLLGLSLAFYTMIMFGFHPVLRRIGLDLGATPLQGAFIRFVTGFLCYVVYLLISRSVVNVKMNYQVNYYMVAGVAWALAPLLSIHAIQFISPTVFASLSRVGPLLTVILTHFFLKGIEKVNWQILLTALLVVIGAILVSTA